MKGIMIEMVIIFMHDAVTAKDYNYYLNRMNFLKTVTSTNF